MVKKSSNKDMYDLIMDESIERFVKEATKQVDAGEIKYSLPPFISGFISEDYIKRSLAVVIAYQKIAQVARMN